MGGAASRRRRFHPSEPVKLAIRIVVSAALLAVLITKIPADDIEPRNTHPGTLAFLAFGLLFTLLGFVLSAWRWQRVFLVFRVRVPLRTLLSHYLAGQFVGNVLPSTIGGDVLRVSRASKTTGAGDVAFASVAIERLSGFVALPLLSFIGFLIEPSLLQADHSWVALTIAAVTVVALVVVLALAASARLAGRFEQHENWMRFVGAVHIGVHRMRQEPVRAFDVLAAAVLYQASVLMPCGARSTPSGSRCRTAPSSPISPRWPPPRCSPSRSRASESAKVCSCCSSVPSAFPPARPSAWGCSGTA